VKRPFYLISGAEFHDLPLFPQNPTGIYPKFPQQAYLALPPESLEDFLPELPAVAPVLPLNCAAVRAII
jgi:hypothetical protein